MQSYAKMRFEQIEITTNTHRVTSYSNWVRDKHVYSGTRCAAIYKPCFTNKFNKRWDVCYNDFAVGLETSTCATHVEWHKRVSSLADITTKMIYNNILWLCWCRYRMYPTLII